MQSIDSVGTNAYGAQEYLTREKEEQYNIKAQKMINLYDITKKNTKEHNPK